MGTTSMVISRVVIIIIMLSSNYYLVAHGSSQKFHPRVCESHIKPGDLMIGGLFDVYGSVNAPCDGQLEWTAISWVESMVYAINLINKRNDILPNVSLGYEIRNYCLDEDVALWTMLTMTSPSRDAEFAEMCPDITRKISEKVVAVIGTGTSSSSLLCVKVGRLHDVPIISYYATSDELSDTHRFPFFFRAIPPDRFQVGAIIDLLRYYNWKYIALFYSVDTYGIHGARQIQLMAEKYDICLAINMPVSSDGSSTNEKNEIRNKLESHEKVSVIVIFSFDTTPAAIIRVAIDIGRKFTIIGSDGWGPEFYSEEEQNEFKPALEGSVFVRFSSVPASPFQDYYKELPTNPEHTSQWYQAYLNELIIDNNCTGLEECTIPEAHHVAESIIDSVFAIAYALDASLQDVCNNNNESCDETINGWTLKDNLHRVSFSTRPNHTFEFDKNGDVTDKYDLKRWQKSEDGEFDMVRIGQWDPSDVESPQVNTNYRPDMKTIISSPMYLNEKYWGTPNGELPRSICIDQCKPGYITIPLEKKCCLGCQQCPEYTIVVNQNETSAAMCLECPVTHWPDVTFTKCAEIIPSYIDYDSLVYILSSAGAGIGLIVTGISAIGLCYYSQHSLIKASSRELSCINIVGLVCTCVVVFIILERPSIATCVMVDVSITTCACMTFSPVLLKVNRIWRIFNATKGRRPRYTGASQQTVIALFVILLQVKALFTTARTFF